MASPAEDAVQEQDAATERFLPIAALALTTAVQATAEGIEPQAPPGMEAAVKLAILAAIISMITSARGRAPKGEPLPIPSPDEIERTADAIAPDVGDAAWRWAVAYAKELGEVGAKQGLSTEDLDKESKRLARALATRSAAESALATAHLVGAPYKIWISRVDPKVRTTHRKLHGHPVPMDKPFRRWPTGQILDFPGDPRAPLRETANCRCKLIFAMTAEGVDEALAPPDLDKAFALAASLESRWGYDDD